MAPICHVMYSNRSRRRGGGAKKTTILLLHSLPAKKMLSSHSPFGRCCFGSCCCPILLWCAAAFSSWMERGYHNNLSFSWLRNKKIRRHGLWAVSESTPWKESSKEVPRIIQEDPENLLRIFWEESKTQKRWCRGDSAEKRRVWRGEFLMGCWERFWEVVLAVLSLLHSLHPNKNITKSVLLFWKSGPTSFTKHKVFECVDDHFFIFPFLSIFHVKMFSFLSVLWTLSGLHPFAGTKNRCSATNESPTAFALPFLILWAVSSPSLGKILWESSKNLSRIFEEDGQICTWIGGTAASPSK